jgi:hypothetical protein
MALHAEPIGQPIRRKTRIVLRPLASSPPLGFFAFGVGTILLTAVELHWVRSLKQASDGHGAGVRGAAGNDRQPVRLPSQGPP